MEDDLLTDSSIGVPPRDGAEWKHVTVLELRQKQQPKVKCLYCDKVYIGGATRIRAHILGNRPAAGVARCTKVQELAKEAFLTVRKLQATKDSAAEEKVKKRKLYDLSQSLASASNHASGSGTQATIPARFKLQTGESVDHAWAKAFYANGVPFSLADDPAFVDAVKMTADNCTGYKPPSAWRLSNGLLDSTLEQIKSELQVDS